MCFIQQITVPFDFSSIRLPVQMESSAAADPTIVRTSGWGQIVLRSPVKSTRYMQTLNLKICAISELLKYWSDYHISTYYQNCAAMVFPDAAVGKVNSKIQKTKPNENIEFFYIIM